MVRYFRAIALLLISSRLFAHRFREHLKRENANSPGRHGRQPDAGRPPLLAAACRIPDGRPIGVDAADALARRRSLPFRPACRDRDHV